MCSNKQKMYEEINALVCRFFHTNQTEDFSDSEIENKWETELMKTIENFENTIICEKKKRNRSAYSIFCAEHRENVKEKFNLTNSRDIIRTLGEMWANMKESNSEHLKKYEKMAQEEKKQNKLEARARSPERAKTREKSPRKPSAYLIFSSEMRKKYVDEFKGKPLGEISQFIGEKWSEIKKDEKKVEKYRKMTENHEHGDTDTENEINAKEDSKEEKTDKKDKRKKSDDKKGEKEDKRKKSDSKEEKTDKKEDKRKKSDKKKDSEEEIPVRRLLEPTNKKKEAMGKLLAALKI